MRLFETKWPALLLWPFSLLYGSIMQIRNWLYDNGLLKQHQLNCTVISVGNIRVGGTGKTPTVLCLAEFLRARGLMVGLLSRGYGRTSEGPVWVSDGRDVLVGPEGAGDEPLLMARALDVPVLVDSNRVRGGRMMLERYDLDVIILDDAFQHRRLYRTMDIVTMAGNREMGNGWCLPAGPLREFQRNLRRADVVWINQTVPHVKGHETRTDEIVARYEPDSIVDGSGRVLPVTLSGKRVLAFCGLASPERFRNTLEQLGAVVHSLMSFPDHHRYQDRDLDRLEQQFRESDCEWLITTEKDWVKISNGRELATHWRCLRVRLVPIDPDQVSRALRAAVSC
jgi:tetraacyldisaccharide 4'-kinase